MEFLFVYGTLMRKYKPNDWTIFLQSNSKYMGEANINGLLYKVDYYPGLVKGEGIVFGELYKLHNAKLTLEKLDEYEDYDPKNKSNSLYVREISEIVLMEENKKMEAWVYYYNCGIDVFELDIEGRFS
jgi:gamma-glutamylcyclotransferase (GGCT)/AIG2-like uncharacterized protein YtfP